jgi:hypothetical protein
VTVATALAQDSTPTFGTTVVIPSGLRGLIYHIEPNTSSLPEFEKLRPRGSIYTSTLNIPKQSFRQGFPGVTSRFEWFAIDYFGRFWIEKPGLYRFCLTSDDGARLFIDNQLIADNDGIHMVQDRYASLRLAGGIHRIRVQYFQGPRFDVALILRYAPPGQDWRIFSTDVLKPPVNPDTWTFPEEPASQHEAPVTRTGEPQSQP